MSLTVERAKEINKGHVTEESLVIHSLNVCYAMGAMAKHFGEDVEHWQAVGYLHDYDYQEFPEEHLQHTEKELTRNSPKNTCSTPKRNYSRRASPKKTCEPFWHTVLKS